MLKSWYSQRYHILLKVEDLGRHVTSTGTYMDFKIKGLFYSRYHENYMDFSKSRYLCLIKREFKKFTKVFKKWYLFPQNLIKSEDF